MVSTNTLNHFGGPKVIDFCVYMYEDIYRSMDINFDIHQRPPSNGYGAIRVHKGTNDI